MEKKQLFNPTKTIITDIQTSANITIAQLKYNCNEVANIISLENAFKNNYVIIKEMVQQRVNSVELENLSNSYIFILDGDMIKGAKQNRVINTSILVAPKGTAIIPVSCVEEGRWEETDEDFDYSMDIAHNSIRYSKLNHINNKSSLEFDFQANQRNVWNNVEEIIHCLDVKSPTNSHTDTYKQLDDELVSSTSNFDINEESNGILILVNNKIISCEIFNNKKLYSDYFNKILVSAAMEAKMKKINHTIEKLDAEKINNKLVNMFKEYQNNIDNVKSNQAVCEGDEMRLNCNDRAFYGLVFFNEAIHKNVQIKLD